MGIELGLRQEQRLEIGLEQRLEQIQEARLELAQAPKMLLLAPEKEKGNWLGGSPEDLRTLLSTNPQRTGESLNYLLGGGWAVEILTGQKREHHDLDVVQISRVPISYRLDLQRPDNYFGIITIPGRVLAQEHTLQVDWQAHKEYPELFKGEVEVYTPSYEFLFLSKIAGFLREPREKDVQDLRALARDMDDSEKSRRLFTSLLTYIPLRARKKARRNRNLFRDVTGSKGEDERALVAEHLVEIVRNLQEGNDSLGVKQLKQFSSTLVRDYQHGLANSTPAGALGFDEKFTERMWEKAELRGFWVKGEKGAELMLPIREMKPAQRKRLLAWYQAERTSEEIETLAQIEGTRLYRAKMAHRQVVDKLLVGSRGKVIGEYSELMFDENSGLVVAIGQPSTDILDRRGKIIAKTRALGIYDWSSNAREVYEHIASGLGFDAGRLDTTLELKNLNAIEQVATITDKSFASYAEGRRRRVYLELMKQGKFGEAVRFSDLVSLKAEFKTRAEATAYEELLDESLDGSPMPPEIRRQRLQTFREKVAGADYGAAHTRKLNKTLDALRTEVTGKSDDESRLFSRLVNDRLVNELEILTFEGLKIDFPKVLEVYEAVVRSGLEGSSWYAYSPEAKTLADRLASLTKLPEEEKQKVLGKVNNELIGLACANTDLKHDAEKRASDAYRFSQAHGLKFTRTLVEKVIKGSLLYWVPFLRAVAPLEEMDETERVAVMAQDLPRFNPASNGPVSAEQADEYFKRYYLSKEKDCARVFCANPAAVVFTLGYQAVPVSPETRERARNYVLSKILPAGGGRPLSKKEITSWTGYFGVQREEIRGGIFAYFDSRANQGYFGQILRTGERVIEGGYLTRPEYGAYLERKTNEFAEARDYEGAALIQRDAGGDLGKARHYAELAVGASTLDKDKVRIARKFNLQAS